MLPRRSHRVANPRAVHDLVRLPVLLDTDEPAELVRTDLLDRLVQHAAVLAFGSLYRARAEDLLPFHRERHDVDLAVYGERPRHQLAVLLAEDRFVALV